MTLIFYILYLSSPESQIIQSNQKSADSKWSLVSMCLISSSMENLLLQETVTSPDTPNHRQEESRYLQDGPAGSHLYGYGTYC